MIESGFTSCEEELLENVTASLVSSAYTDDGGTWKSSSGSTVESLTKCEDLELEEESTSPQRGADLSPRLGHKPPRWADLTLRPQPESLSPREPLSPRTEVRPFRRSGIPVVHQTTAPLQTKLLTKCQSLQDLSKCLALLHTERLNNTYNSTDTINSQSLSSTKDSGFQRSYSSNSICSVRRRNKYDHVESKVKQYIRNIKDNERKHKALKRNSVHEELGSPSRRSSLQDTELLTECPSGGSKSCCNTRRSSYQDELRVLFNIDDESNRALTTLIKKLEVEKFERDLLIENLQVKYHELNNKLTSANETISDLKNQVTLSPLATSAQCLDEPLASSSTSKPRPQHHRRYSDRSHHHHIKRRLSPVQSLSSQASRAPQDTGAGPCCSSRSSQNSSRPTPQPPCRKKLNLPRDDPFLKVKRWQDSLTGVDSSDSNPYPVVSSPLQKSTTLAYLPASPIPQATPPPTPTPQSSHVPKSSESSRTYFKAFDSSFHLGRSKTSPDIKRSTVFINIGDHSSKKSKKIPMRDENSNLCASTGSPAKELPSPVKQITVLNIYETEDGTKVVQDVSKRSSSACREPTPTGGTKIQVNPSPEPVATPKSIQAASSFDPSHRVLPEHHTKNSPSAISPTKRPIFGLSQSKTTPNMKRVSINLCTDIRSSTSAESSDSLNTTTEDDDVPNRRPPSVPPNTRLFKELSSLKSCLNEVDEQIHVLKHGIDNLIKSSSQKSVNTFLQQP